MLRFTQRAAQKTEEHTVKVDAYSVSEAIVQACVELDAQHEFIAKGYDQKILKVGPDTEKLAKQVADLLSEFRKATK